MAINFLHLTNAVLTLVASGGKVNIPFIVLVSVLTPALIGVIVYYVLLAKKKKNKIEPEDDYKTINDYEDK